MMRNGRPYTCENGFVDDALVTDLDADTRRVVFAWILEMLTPRRTVNSRHTSYGIKHLLEKDTGIYLTNNQFKDAMLLCGYKPRNSSALNWCYTISETSPAFG